MIETDQRERINLFLFTFACVYYLADMLLPVVQYLSSVYIQIFMVLLIILMIITGRNNDSTIRLMIPFMPFLTLQLIQGLLTSADSIRSIIHVSYATIVFVIPAVICF